MIKVSKNAPHTFFYNKRIFLLHKSYFLIWLAIEARFLFLQAINYSKLNIRLFYRLFLSKNKWKNIIKAVKE